MSRASRWAILAILGTSLPLAWLIWRPRVTASIRTVGPDQMQVRGRVTDGSRGLAGVRIYPDRQPRLSPGEALPVAISDARGRFQLDLRADDDVLVVEKDGWRRDLVPRSAWLGPLVLRPEPDFHQEAVCLVRLAFPELASSVDEAALRERLFSRRPGVASAANYLYEVSRGALSLVEGRTLHLTAPPSRTPRRDAQNADLARWVVSQLKDQPWGDCDRIDNRTGAPGPDGKPDHLWIFAPGHPQSVTGDDADLKAVCLLLPLPWAEAQSWPLLFMTDEVPVGNIVHEAFHGMGEHRVDDLYLEDGSALTAGIWDLMDGGQYRGWDRSHPRVGPWAEDTGYSPSHPSAWVRAELWYQGRFQRSVQTETLTGSTWEGWLAPVVRAPSGDPQWLKVPDPAKPGRFFSFEVRRPWGFERGRIGGRFGPGYQGLVVALVDPDLLTLHGDPRGAMRVVDAHPGTPEPPKPRLPLGLWELDDAAFNVGPGEQPRGQRGSLAWEVLEADPAGRLRFRVWRLPSPGR